MRSITGNYTSKFSACSQLTMLTLYSDENTKEEDLIHPEDIEHFRLHDELEDEAERVAALDKLAIVEQNIPAKFRRDG